MKETRRLSTILFVDIEGYTALMQVNEEKAMQFLTSFKTILEELVLSYNGQIIQYFGDGCLLSFHSTSQCVSCAINLQTSYRKMGIPIRMGIHLGEVVFKENNVFGDGVNVASRIESIGVAGGILVSNSVRDQIKNKSEFKLKSMGYFDFKNIKDAIEVFSVVNDGLLVPTRKELQKGKGVPSIDFKPRRWLIIAASFLLISLVLYNIFSISTRQISMDKTEIIKSIAVLPLINFNKKAENFDYFSDGVTQEIIDELTKIKSLVITPFTTSFQYKNTKTPIIDISEELNVNFLISGSARIIGDSIRLSIELFDPKSNERIWNGIFNESMENAPSLQGNIARQVAKRMDTKLTSGEEGALNIAETTSGEAFDLFLKAKSAYFALTNEGFQTSIKALERAIDLDPEYAKAHSLLAWVTLIQSTAWLGSKISTSESINLIAPHLEEAMALDSTNSDNFLISANTNLFFKGKIRDAEKDVDHALSLNSWTTVSNLSCMCTIVAVYAALGELEKAKNAARISREIDPANVFIFWDLGNIHMIEGEFQKAQVLYGAGLEATNIPLFHFFVGWSYFHDNKLKKAQYHLESAYELDPFNFTVTYLSNLHYEMGNFDKSQHYKKELIQRIAKGEPNLNLAMAMIAAVQTNPNETLTWLEKAQSENDYALAYMVNMDPIFKPLYEEPRFIEIRKKMQYYE